ncbi:MAG: DUF4956 domain-containing protein [Gemmatimonadota bacterium]|nr:DUF4956 domain-containing protein [Gemmatimonadota bacterium]
MASSHSKGLRGHGLGRVVAYYGLFAVILIALVEYMPWASDIVSGARLDALSTGAGADEIFGPDAPPAVGSAFAAGTWTGALVAALSMLGALAIMIPVTWVYMTTHRQRGYNESVVHTLLILPVAVTGIIMVVQDNLALAFSLAGVVAAVRFRTTLDDTKDAVYVFLAIGVGLAAGVQALGIALTLSVIFNLVILTLWYTNFGNVYADQHTRAGALGLGDVLAGPQSSIAALQVGDPAVLEAVAVEDLKEMAERAVRFERHIGEERKKKKQKRANTLVIVHATAAEPAQAYVDPLLTELSVRFKLVEIEPTTRGQMLVYVARLDDQAVEGALMDRLREGHGGVITAAELRSMKGLKPRP